MDLEERDICHFCSDLIKATSDTAEHPSQRPHHATYGLLLSSSKGCVVCQLIASLWPHFSSALIRYGVSYELLQGTQQGYPIEITIKETRRMQTGVCWVFLEASLESTITALTFISHFTITTCVSGGKTVKQNHAQIAFKILRLLGADTVSALPVWKTPATALDEKLAAIQSWMRDCQSRDGHSKCRPVAYAPLRLVAVGHDGSPIKLVGRDSTTEATKYVALSYCWGKSLQLCTTKSTLSKFTEEIPSELIPKTWIDAIQIARALRIPHVWIDALCIVHDDEAEWQREVTQMSKIYQGSLLTIAAVQSADSCQGCFPSSDNDGFQEGELCFRTRPDSLGGRSSIVRVYREDIRNRAGGNTAISNRGWTLQEQLLSPRLVLCMQPEVHWQCRAGYQTESGLSFELAELLQANNKLLPHYDGLQTSDRWHRRAWRRIIEGYSLREFSYSEDRIPAIAGITEYFSSVLDDAPILGLWRKSFAMDLAWLRGGGPPQMADITGLPSWTWFTGQGCVLYTIGDRYADHEDNGVVESLRLLDWDVQWQGAPFVSPVDSALVRVEAPVREIRIVPFEEGNRHIPPYFQVFEENLQPTAQRMIPWRCAGRFDDGDATTAATYLCLLLYSEPRNSESGDVREVFLILGPVEMEKGTEMRYKRVGVARIWGESPTFDSANTMSIVLV